MYRDKYLELLPREDLGDEIVNELTSKQHLNISGFPGCGKTTIIQTVIRNLRASDNDVFQLDIDKLQEKTRLAFWITLYNVTQTKQHLQSNNEGPYEIEEIISNVKKNIEEMKKGSVIIFDHFDLFESISKDDFFRLRNFSEKNDKFHYLIISNKSLGEIERNAVPEDPSRLSYNFKLFRMPLMTKEELEHCIIQRGLNNIKSNEFYNSTGGYPPLVSAVLEYALKNSNTTSEINISNMNYDIEYDDLIISHFTLICRYLTEKQYAYFKKIAASENKATNATGEREERMLIMENLLLEDTVSVRIFSDIFKSWFNETSNLSFADNTKITSKLASSDGKICYDSENNVFVINNRPIELLDTQKKLLLCLWKNKGYVCDKQLLYKTVWNSEEKQNVLVQSIKRLREKIENDSNNPIFIVTVYKRGYKLENFC